MIACITGATGFIGSHIVDRLLEKGYKVRALTRKTSNLRWLKGKNVEYMEGDVRDASSLESFVRNADYVYHVAGIVKARNREEYFEGNEHATRNMLDVTARFAPGVKRFLHVSSQTVAGPATALTEPSTEDMPCKPITTYGESKLAAEEAVREYTGKLPWTIVRAPAVFGPRDTEIFIYFQTIAKGLNSMIGFDDKRLSLIHSDDLTRGMIIAAESDRSTGEIYFITSKEFYSWPQVGDVTAKVMKKRFFTVRVPHAIVYGIAAVAQAIASLQGKAATLNIEKARDITQQYWICDPSKARDQLGFEQQLSLEEGVRSTVNWYKEQEWL